MPCANNGQYGNVDCPLNVCKYEKDERKTFFFLGGGEKCGDFLEGGRLQG